MKPEVVIDTLLPITIGIRELCRQLQINSDSEITLFFANCNWNDVIKRTYDLEDFITRILEDGNDYDLHNLHGISQLVPISITSLFDKQAHIVRSNRLLFCHILVKYNLMSKSKYQHHRKEDKEFRKIEREKLHNLFTRNIKLFNKLLPLIQYNQLSELIKLTKSRQKTEQLVVAQS